MAIANHMREKDIRAFRTVAMVQRLYIIVRRTNAEAIKWIGRDGFMPKPIDCKPKTADRDVTIDGRLRETAGLVVDPTLPGMDQAFVTARKAEKAAKAWEKFAAEHPPARCLPRDGREVRTWPAAQPGWAVQMSKESAHYGCLMWSNYPQGMNGRYAHGDYDLFGIAPADDPGGPVLRLRETLSGAPHARGPRTQSVQFAVNALAGVPVVKHGEQELYADFDDEPLDVFCPDGSIVELPNDGAARDFYRTRLRGRQVFTEIGGTEFPAFGQWLANRARDQ